MKLKHVCILGWIIGAMLMILPFLLAVARTLWGDVPVGIVGGADWPIFKFVLSEYTWMAHLGVTIFLTFIIVFLRHRK